MPVRLGFPIGIKGIVQLVQGPQYATGVGLVRYGAQQLVDAEQRGGAVAGAERTVAEVVMPAGNKGFWNWLRAAF
jgi:cell division protein FtsA